LLLKMLEPDHTKRISASEALKHPYFSNRYISLNEIIPEASLDEKPHNHHSPCASDLPQSATKCLLSFKSVISTVSPISKNSKYMSQEETAISFKTPNSATYGTGTGTSTGRELTLEKLYAKQVGRNARTSLFSHMKKKEESDSENEDIHEDGDEEQCMVGESFKAYHQRLVSVNKPREMMQFAQKKAVY